MADPEETYLGRTDPLEGEFDQQTDTEHPQKPRTITTRAAAVMVSFPRFVLNAPRKIGSTPAGWFFSVLVVWQRGAVVAVIRNLTINLLTEYRQSTELPPSLSI